MSTFNESVSQAEAFLNDAGLPGYYQLFQQLLYLLGQAKLSDLPGSNSAIQKAEELVNAVTEKFHSVADKTATASLGTQEMPVSTIWLETPVGIAFVPEYQREPLSDALLSVAGVTGVESYGDYRICCDVTGSDVEVMRQLDVVRLRVSAVFQDFDVWPQGGVMPLPKNGEVTFKYSVGRPPRLRVDQRVAKIPELVNRAGPAGVFGQMAMHAILAERGYPDNVNWSNVERDVIERCVVEHGQDPDVVLRILRSYSPGAIGVVAQAALDPLVHEAARRAGHAPAATTEVAP